MKNIKNKNKQSREDWIINQQLKEIFRDSDINDLCIYCGFGANVRDHVIPASYYSKRTYGQNMILVPACSICNGLASNYLPISLLDRKNVIKERFFRKYEKVILNQKEWTDAEINELKGNLKNYIKNKNFFKKIICQRYNNLCTITFFGKEKDNVEAIDNRIMSKLSLGG